MPKKRRRNHWNVPSIVRLLNESSPTSCLPGQCGLGRKAGTEFDGVSNLGGFGRGTVTTPPDVLGACQGLGEAWFLHPKIKAVVIMMKAISITEVIQFGGF